MYTPSPIIKADMGKGHRRLKGKNKKRIRLEVCKRVLLQGRDVTQPAAAAMPAVPQEVKLSADNSEPNARLPGIIP